MEEEMFGLTPKGIALVAMMETGLVEDMDDPRIEGFWHIFFSLMERNGYTEIRCYRG